MSKQFWGVIVVIVLIFIGIFALSNNKSDSDNSSSKSSLSQHTFGQGTTGVTLTEYGDFQCPYCGQYFPIVKQVKEQYKDKITFQFRNFPLQNVHPNAFAASRAAEAAGMQGKFWEMHDLLYENQTAWSSSSTPSELFNQYAKQLGLNVDKFQQDFASAKVNNIINADLAEGRKQDITATPTFLVNGKKVQIGLSVADFQKVLDAAIAKKQPSNAGTTEQTQAGQTPATDSTSTGTDANAGQSDTSANQ